MRGFDFAMVLLVALPLAAQDPMTERALEMAERAREMELENRAMTAGIASAMAAKATTMEAARAGILAQTAGVKVFTRDRDDRDYRRGKGALEKRDWQGAVEYLQQVIDNKGPQTEGALYWKAYALNKLGRRQEATEALAELQKAYPSSGWINDAKALEVEVKRATGQNTPPESESDEDLKLLAINSLMNSDPERALPLLEKLLKGSNPPALKERALFVLASSRTPRANEILLQTAKGGSNPELQLKAVEYLGVMGGGRQENGALLALVYQSSKDRNVRAAVLRSYMISQDKTRLFEAAKSEPDPELRRDAIRFLGSIHADRDTSRFLAELARNEKDPKIQAAAIHSLGIQHSAESSEALAGLYQALSAADAKRRVIESLFMQQNAKALIDVARKETDAGLKREAVEKLSLMRSKESTDFMMELLNK